MKPAIHLEFSLDDIKYMNPTMPAGAPKDELILRDKRWPADVQIYVVIEDRVVPVVTPPDCTVTLVVTR